jgi:SAM-dependent methyltransferase
MTHSFSNVYDDDRRAEAYATLEFPGTYALAYRDLPALLRAHVRGRHALDFGCGTGRSTRFLRRLGFEPVGVDIAPEMVRRARAADPDGTYHVITGNGLEDFTPGAFDVALSVFTFDNVPTREAKVTLFRALGRLLTPDGRIVNVVSSPEIYVNEWASFTTRDFPENRRARSGDTVRIVMLDVADRRPVEDILWTDDDYRAVFQEAGLVPVAVHRPLATAADPGPWVSETSIPPWVIYVLARDAARRVP